MGVEFSDMGKSPMRGKGRSVAPTSLQPAEPHTSTGMTNINSAAKLDREQARKRSGQFGNQQHSQPEPLPDAMQRLLASAAAGDTVAVTKYGPDGDARFQSASISMPGGAEHLYLQVRQKATLGSWVDHRDEQWWTEHKADAEARFSSAAAFEHSSGVKYPSKAVFNLHDRTVDLETTVPILTRDFNEESLHSEILTEMYVAEDEDVTRGEAAIRIPRGQKIDGRTAISVELYEHLSAPGQRIEIGPKGALELGEDGGSVELLHKGKPVANVTRRGPGTAPGRSAPGAIAATGNGF